MKISQVVFTLLVASVVDAKPRGVVRKLDEYEDAKGMMGGMGKTKDDDDELFPPCAQCDEDSDCASDMCMKMGDYKVCARSDGLMPDKCFCDMDTDCLSGVCMFEICLAQLGTMCYIDNECASGYCNMESMECDVPPPSMGPTPSPTLGATPEPTAEATPAPTSEATPAPTPGATPEPTPEPTDAPVTSPVAVPTAPVAAPTFTLPSCSNCLTDGECESGVCRFVGGQSLCAEFSSGTMAVDCRCNGDSDCTTGWCEDNECQKLKRRGMDCEDDKECKSGNCVDFFGFLGTCQGRN